MRLRCFLMRYGDGSEALRWVRDDGTHWVQQEAVLRLRDGSFEHTGGDPTALHFMPGVDKLVEDGLAEEL